MSSSISFVIIKELGNSIDAAFESMLTIIIKMYEGRKLIIISIGVNAPTEAMSVVHHFLHI